MNAKEILMKAVQCDQAGRILEAQYNYQEGIQILMELVEGEMATLVLNFILILFCYFFFLFFIFFYKLNTMWPKRKSTMNALKNI